MTPRPRDRRERRPAAGTVDLGDLRRPGPVSDAWGFDRGTPVDRHYIEGFLEEHRADVRGHVLEVKDAGYTERFGSGVTRSDVLDVDPGNRCATLVADLAAGDGLPSDRFDCFVLTQTLQYVYDLGAAVAHVHRVLRPGGVCLATLPCISRIDDELQRTDHWRFTAASATALFEGAFREGRVEVESYGNVLAAIAFLMGLAREELTAEELDVRDPRFPVTIAVRAVKAGRV
jgi:SAM-dependent methyltransferase